MRRRGHSDPVTADVRQFVMERDRECFAHKLDPDHACRDSWGTPHSPYDVERCSLDHVKKDLRMGKRAPSQPAFLLLLCAAANVGVPSKAVREAEREYLRALYPEAWA